MEKTRNFQIVYAGPTNLCHFVDNLRCLRHDLSDMLKLQAAFLYSIYHQRAGKPSLFHMRGVDFMHFNTCCTAVVNGCMNNKSCLLAVLD